MPVATNNLSADNFFSTTLSSGISASDTTISVNSVPTASEGYLVIEPDSSTNREIIYYTSKTGSAVVCPSAALGRGVGGTSAASHSANVTIQGNVTAQHWLALQDASAMTGLHTYFDESFNDYVVSGATVSLATGLIASVSAGTVYINGRRLTVNAFSKTLTASKETYFDLIETDGSNIATVSYTELGSGGTGSTPAANGMHIGMVRSNASLLATIFQNGQYDYFSNPLKPTTPVSGQTIQTKYFVTSAVATGTTVMPFDDSIPQSNEGDQYMNLAITPKYATSILTIEVFTAVGFNGSAATESMALFQDGTANALAATNTYISASGATENLSLKHVMVSGTTSPTTFKVRIGADGAGTTTFNGTASARKFGGVVASSITITETLV